MRSTPEATSLPSLVGAELDYEDRGLEETGESAPRMRLTPQSVPPLSKFSGEETNPGEFFQEWKEQFELTADLLRWDERAKLVNLITRLRGQAYSFYRSCSAAQRGSYTLLMAELGKRFTPVTIQAIQTSLFHDRKQGAGEMVDVYAQDLRRLFGKAYPLVQQGSKEAEELGKAVLASQFISDLRVELKRKVAGQEGDFDSLIVKARFEEAKEKNFGKELEVAPPKLLAGPSKLPSSGQHDHSTAVKHRNQTKEGTRPASGPFKCHSCGKVGHFARSCPLKSKAATPEAQGRKVAAVVPEQPTGTLANEWQDRVIEGELKQVMATLHGVSLSQSPKGVALGATPVVQLEIEGDTVDALVDTGSPVSIISTKFLFHTLARNKKSDQTGSDWAEEVRRRLYPSMLKLRSYSGNDLPIVKQLELAISRGQKHVKAWVQVQQDAPVDFLLGTDLQPLLGFQLKEDSSIDESDGCGCTTPGLKGSTSTVGHVYLLEAVRVPVNFQRLVPVEKVGFGVEDTVLFTPKVELPSAEKIQMEDSLMGAGSCGMLAIRNPGPRPVFLDKGEVLGSIEKVKVVSEAPFGSDVDGCCCSIVRGELQDVSRENKLLDSLPTDNWDLDVKKQERLIKLIMSYHDIFALDESELGCANDVTHSIDTGTAKPIKQYPRRVPFALKEKVAEMVAKMVARGVVEPSKSPWASPIVLVAKKDGSTRFCVDYRKLNAITKMDVYPLPRVDDLLDLLSNNDYFSTLDLASGYWQVKMEESSKEKTAFTTEVGLYEFCVMPFGLCNAPVTFQRLMEKVLHGLVGKVCLVYLDDVLVLGKEFDEHLRNLELVWERLRESGLHLKPEKCHLVQEEVEYLGFVVSGRGITTSPSKVQAVKEFPVPEDVTSLRSFLGLSSYYRRFIANFSTIAAPLFHLTKKDVPFVWSNRCQEAFQQLKDTLSSASVLAFPDFTKPFVLETDASGKGIGAILSQQEPNMGLKPIAFASRTLQKHEHNYGITELEGLAVIWAAALSPLHLWPPL